MNRLRPNSYTLAAGTFKFTGRVLPTFKEFTMIGSITASRERALLIGQHGMLCQSIFLRMICDEYPSTGVCSELGYHR
jgi:hypothetical protein